MNVVQKTIAISWCAALLLTGCGGAESVDIGVVAPPPPSFLGWARSVGGDRVIDGYNHLFSFYSDTGCLYNRQTGQENTAFCLVPGSNVVSYGPYRGKVANVLISDGTCHAAIVDLMTGNFSDIELDAYGREVVLTTQLQPALCAPQ